MSDMGEAKKADRAPRAMAVGSRVMAVVMEAERKEEAATVVEETATHVSSHAVSLSTAPRRSRIPACESRHC